MRFEIDIADRKHNLVLSLKENRVPGKFGRIVDRLDVRVRKNNQRRCSRANPQLFEGDLRTRRSTARVVAVKLFRRD